MVPVREIKMGTARARTRSHLCVTATERERVARDLHDGVVQSLIATEMQVELMRRRSGNAATLLDVTETLASVQEIIRLEVRRLRGQIEQLRSVPSHPPVLCRLTEIVEAFRRETGIATTFVCGLQEDSIPRHLAHELPWIVEEALNNVRRHSSAGTVQVSLSLNREILQVVIQDNGCGFGFTGSRSLAELQAARKGPRTIRERVHSVRGDLALESDPDRGARLVIRFAANRTAVGTR